MRSCANLVLLCALAGGVTAAYAQPPSARTRYEEARARQTVLRQALDAPVARPALLRDVRALVADFEDIVRRFPTTGYADDALFQAAELSADAYWQFGEARDRTTATRLYESIGVHYPTSSLLARVPDAMARLTAAGASALQKGRAPGPLAPKGVAAPVPRIAQAQEPVRLLRVDRDALPEALRLSIELEREVSFHVERLDGPPRVFIDFDDTRAAEAVRDLVLPFADDVVRQVRVGRQPSGRTRIVFDLRQDARHSVFTRYAPYRVVVDFARPASAALPRSPVAAAPAPLAARSLRLPASSAVVLPFPDLMGISPVVESRDARGPVTDPAARVPLPVSPSAPPTNADGGFSLARQLGLAATRIAIDPGHGGHDPGAKVQGLTEADLVLSVALRLEKLLRAQAGIDVVLTRRTNAYVPLEERTAIANRAGADLFLSIHANASANSAAQGIETYFLNFASSEAAEAVAARENASSSRTMRELQDIVKAIALDTKVDESRDFARLVQTSLHARLSESHRAVRNLGVKQAPFMVLIGAAMPSVLAEVSFLTNPDEASRLKTDRYRQQIAEALFAAIMRYRQTLKAVPALATR